MAPHPRIRHAAVWFTLACFLITHSPVPAQAHLEGNAAGLAANTAIRPLISQSSARALVPLYSATPPQTSYFYQGSLATQSSATLAACQLSPGDPTCQALLGARTSANTPRDTISAFDPTVSGARRISSHPASTLEDIASYYSGCQVDTLTAPQSELHTCRTGPDAPTLSCSRNLQVNVTRESSCTPGDWFAHAGSGSTDLAVQCVPDRPLSQQHFRVSDAGAALVHVDVDMTRPLTFPEMVATVPGADQRGVWIADNHCSGDACQLTAMLAAREETTCTGSGGDAGNWSCTSVEPFLKILGSCPPGTLGGDSIVYTTGTYDEGLGSYMLDRRTCWAPSATPTPDFGSDITHVYPNFYYWIAVGPRPIAGWAPDPAFGPIPQMTVHYDRPRTSVTTSDVWEDQCPSLESAARCQMAGAPRCIDGPSTRWVDGVELTRSCWRYETPLRCPQAPGTQGCGELRAAGCQPIASTCLETNPQDASCVASQDTYACPVAPLAGAAVSNCPTNVFCIAGSCFDTRSTGDADFARSMALLEAAREAAVYLDTDTMQVFRGESNSCRDRLFTNCCDTNARGAGMANHGLFGVGSRLVFDILMNADNRAFVTQGLTALLTSGGFSGSFTSYGVTVAVNGTALPAGSSVLLSTDSLVVAFDPWSLAISVLMYAVMSLVSCNTSEATLAMKEGARLCHTVGSYCSSCIRLLGQCIACIEHTTGKCCFNSVLARIVNEQGRTQLGRAWGASRTPDCSGFSIAQLQTLDFAAMDLSEFYASIVPTLPPDASVRERITNRAGNCYYGKGKC